MKSQALVLFTALTFSLNPLALAGTSSGDSSSVNDSATTTAAQNNAGKVASLLTAGMYGTLSAKEFGECSGANKSACAMGALFAGMAALSLAQAAEHAKAADAATTTADDTASTGTSDTLTAGTDTSALTATTAALKAGINGSTADLATGAVTTADGGSYTAGDFSSPSSMAKAGFSADQMAQAQAVAAKVNAKVGALTATNGFEEGGGSGSTTAASDAPADPAAVNKTAVAKVDREPAQFSGLIKSFNGESIGVAQDSIFAMMSRRYQYKDRQHAFIDAAKVQE